MKRLLTILLFLFSLTSIGQTPMQEYFALLGQSTGYDMDAQAYFDREATAGYTMTTAEKIAVNTFIVGLKSNGIYSKISEMWLFIGGTATPLGLAFKNASYNLSYVGALTYASTGITTKGTNSYIVTNFIPSGNIAFNNAHLSVYSRTSTAGGATSFDIGSHSGGSVAFILCASAADGTAASCIHSSTTADKLLAGNTNGSGFFVGSRTSATHHVLVRNGSVLATQSGQTGTGVSAKALYIGAYNSNGSANGFTAREYCFASAGAGLTDSESATFSTLVNQLQTALNRNVY